MPPPPVPEKNLHVPNSKSHAVSLFLKPRQRNNRSIKTFDIWQHGWFGKVKYCQSRQAFEAELVQEFRCYPPKAGSTLFWWQGATIQSDSFLLNLLAELEGSTLVITNPGLGHDPESILSVTTYLAKMQLNVKPNGCIEKDFPTKIPYT